MKRLLLSIILLFIFSFQTSSLAKTIIVKGSIVNVRRGPGAEFKVIDKVKKGREFKVLDETQKWIKVELPGDKKGWIHKSLVRPIQLKKEAPRLKRDMELTQIKRVEEEIVRYTAHIRKYIKDGEYSKAEEYVKKARSLGVALTDPVVADFHVVKIKRGNKWEKSVQVTTKDGKNHEAIIRVEAIDLGKDYDGTVTVTGRRTYSDSGGRLSVPTFGTFGERICTCEIFIDGKIKEKESKNIWEIVTSITRHDSFPSFNVHHFSSHTKGPWRIKKIIFPFKFDLRINGEAVGWWSNITTGGGIYPVEIQYRYITIEGKVYRMDY